MPLFVVLPSRKLPGIWRQVGLQYAGGNAGADGGAIDENVAACRAPHAIHGRWSRLSAIAGRKLCEG